MTIRRIVVALGGNAIKQAHEHGTVAEQFRNVDTASRQIARLVQLGYEVVVTHGNGPQVGSLLLQQEEAQDAVPPMSLAVCGAMTQGQIGWMFQNCLSSYLEEFGIDRSVCSIVTQTEVSLDDPDFLKLSKPVGAYFTSAEAEKYRSEKGWVSREMKSGVDQGWRRVVPSPEPLRIVEADAINHLVGHGVVVVAVGGGGVPVYRNREGRLEGSEAVVDKDKAAFLLAKSVDADALLILTDVDNVYINYGTSEETSLESISLDDIVRFQDDDQFQNGSMGPKVEACRRFVEWSAKKAIITSLRKAVDAVEGHAGTHIEFSSTRSASISDQVEYSTAIRT